MRGTIVPKSRRAGSLRGHPAGHRWAPQVMSKGGPESNWWSSLVWVSILPDERLNVDLGLIRRVLLLVRGPVRYLIPC